MSAPPPLGRPSDPPGDLPDWADRPAEDFPARPDQPLSLPDPFPGGGPDLPPVRPARAIRPAKSRVVLVEQLVHVGRRGEPTPVSDRFSRGLTSDETPYRREFTAGPDWAPLDCGWLAAGVSQLRLKNEEGSDRLTVPTDGEKAAEARRVVELGTGGEDFPWVEDFARVRPGESLRLEPTRLAKLRVRCVGGTARCSLFLTPE